MVINKIPTVSFKGLINDAHAHVGHWSCNGEERIFSLQNIDTFIKSPLKVTIQDKEQEYTIAHTFISNLDAFYKNGTYANEITANQELINMANGNAKYALMYACQPTITNNTKDIEKMFLENSNSFVGLKFHTDALKDDLTNPIINQAYCKYLEFAKKKQLPCLFHSQTIQNGKNYASIQDIHNLAKKFPTVPIILGHCGGNDGVDKVIEAVKCNDSKLYCDISWLDWKDGLPDGVHNNTKKLIKELKDADVLDRIFFGTDMPLGCFGEHQIGELSAKSAYERTISGLKTMIKNNFGSEADEIIHKIFYKNADDLFFKKTMPNPLSNKAVKKNSKTKTGLAICAGILAIAGIVYYAINSKKTKITPFQNGTITIKQIKIKNKS